MYDFSNKRLNKDKIDYVIYHSPCTDGFTSALCAYLYFKKTGRDLNQIKFHGFQHGDNMSYPDLTDKKVLICDFSFKNNVFDEFKQQTNGNILVLDHHKTAQKELELVGDEYKVFDMNHCGAYITWTYFFGFDNIPDVISYVEDNDLWIKRLPYTREFTSFVFSLPFEFEQYEKLLDNDYIKNTVIPNGIGMQKQNDDYIKQLSKKTIPRFIQINDKYYFVACLKSDILKSELGNKISDYLPYCNFSAVYSNDHFKNMTTFSLRSLNSLTDVSEIAKLFGGGGHRNASGMAQNYIVDQIPSRVIDEYRLYFIMNSLYETQISDENTQFYFTSINAPLYKKHLVKYLMQSRNIVVNNNTSTTIQEALAVMRVNKNDSNYTRTYNGSYTWHYNGTGVEVIGCFDELFLDWLHKKDPKINCEIKSNIVTFKFDSMENMNNFFIKI